jgi:hypothetical protein
MWPSPHDDESRWALTERYGCLIGARVSTPGQYGAMKDLLAMVDDVGYLGVFTSLARHLLATAGDEAQRMGAADVRTVHLVYAVYALVNEPESLAMLALTMMDVDSTEVTTAIEAAARAPIVDVPQHVPFAAESHTVLRVALEEALAMDHKEIGSGHPSSWRPRRSRN